VTLFSPPFCLSRHAPYCSMPPLRKSVVASQLVLRPLLQLSFFFLLPLLRLSGFPAVGELELGFERTLLDWQGWLLPPLYFLLLLALSLFSTVVLKHSYLFISISPAPVTIIPFLFLRLPFLMDLPHSLEFTFGFSHSFICRIRKLFTFLPGKDVSSLFRLGGHLCCCLTASPFFLSCFTEERSGGYSFLTRCSFFNSPPLIQLIDRSSEKPVIQHPCSRPPFSVLLRLSPFRIRIFLIHSFVSLACLFLLSHCIHPQFHDVTILACAVMLDAPQTLQFPLFTVTCPPCAL